MGKAGVASIDIDIPLENAKKEIISSFPIVKPTISLLRTLYDSKKNGLMTKCSVFCPHNHSLSLLICSFDHERRNEQESFNSALREPSVHLTAFKC